MNRLALSLAALALALPAFANAAEYQFDAAHTRAGFRVRHMMISWAAGEFGAVSGTVNYDEKNPASLSVDASVDATTIDTREPKRDEHLRSPDFFDVAKFPKLTFKSKKAEVQADKTIKLTGDLTIKGVTKEVAFTVDAIGMGKNPWGQVVLATNATAKINRKDFGLTWNKALEAGGVLVGEDVEINLGIEVNPKAPAAPAAAEAKPEPKKAGK